MKKHILGKKLLNFLRFLSKHRMELQGCIISPELEFLLRKKYTISSEEEFKKYYFFNELEANKEYIAFEIEREDVEFIRKNFVAINKNLYSLKLINTPVIFEYKYFENYYVKDFNMKKLFILNLNKKGMRYFAK